ncbi:axonemal dynein light intermediate polypeptide 1 isoform X2 [Melospiza melodia melodia]|uniref:axonemal dynein light intermediate polypeptide 1 isoform X2 n=1 Tax=Melospiza melodia melodia TaxID=1914991 RepID=UPI002FD1F8A6
MAAPPESLLRYCPPVVVSHRDDRPSAAGQAPRTPAGFATQQPQELLNLILPPREWEEAQKLWVQEVSTAPSTRRDVVQLQEQLDRQLQQRQARETGLCPVRRELYTQCFDELIRQTTVSCAERGLLLLRVRDELQLTLSAYQALYESSVAFGVRKALQAEQGKAHLEKRDGSKDHQNTQLTLLGLSCSSEACCTALKTAPHSTLS